MSRIKVAIACQGGGSQTAFTAGALKALVEADMRDKFEVVSISGTSGGAVCAALVWYAARRQEPVLWQRLYDFWDDNTASSPAEEFFNHWVVETLRLVNQGMMPALQLSPSSPYAQFMMSAAASGVPKAFVDFGAMVSKFIDFDEIASWGPDQARPALVIGAANVNSGKLVKFASTRQAIRLEHVLASCAVPSIFPAVEIDGEGYWDGLFSDNPPIDELIRPRTVGEGNIPEEIWLIKINPTTWDRIPVQSAEIFDRRNQLEGNISLFHQLNQLELINDLILAGAFKSQFLKTLEVKTAVRIPRAFADEPMKPYHIPCIEMPDEIAKNLDYLGKVDRSTANIRYLRDQGEAAARAFIAERERVVAANQLPGLSEA